VYEFNYHRPASIAEAAELLSTLEDAQIIAGGMTLLPTMKMRLAQPSDLVDLGDIDELTGIHEDGNNIVIGAMTCHTAVVESELVNRSVMHRFATAEHWAGRWPTVIRQPIIRRPCWAWVPPS